MTDGWETVAIGDLCKTGAGGTPLKSRKEYYEGGTVPWLLSGEVAQGEITESRNFITEEGLQNSSAKMFPSGTVLVAMYGATAGQVGKLRVPAATNQAVCGVFPNDRVMTEYLYYALLSKKNELVATATGNAQPNISQIKIKNTVIPLPSIPEQKCIVAILDDAFEGIDAAIANTEQNLANARELFESYLDEIFTANTNGWMKTTLGEIANFKNGLNFTKNSKGEHINIVGVKAFKSNYWVPFEELDSVTINGVLSEAYTLKKGDILTVRSNGNKELIGRCILAGEVPRKTSHSGFTIRIRTKSSDVKPSYLVHYLKSGIVRKMLVSFGGGANISSLNQKALSSLPVLFPSPTEQKAIVAQIESIKAGSVNLLGGYQQKLHCLRELRQSFLQKAFAGELTAKPEQVVEEAVG